MCGIAFILSKKNSEIPKNLSEHFINYLYDRGPDNQNYYSKKNFSLISTRLSIIDTDKRSNQPLFSHCENYIIIFNGMIYNYRDLKNNHLKDFKFISDSDTEVILNLYIKYGNNCAKYLDGMFSFIIYDKKKNEFFISRDKTGIKPLYYYSDDNYFIFSSSFRSLLNFSKKNISNKGLINYFNFGYSLEPNTIIDDIKIFPNSYFAEIKKNKICFKKYFELKNLYFKENYSKKINLTKIEDKLLDLIKKHTYSDVPICLFLSSGFDSNIIASFCKKLNIKIDTITLSFERFRNTKDDESIYVKQLNKVYKFNNKVIYVKDDELLDLKKKFDKIIDHPSTDGFNTFLICHFAKKYGYKVAISGLGGDEIFNTYGNLSKIRIIKSISKITNFFYFTKIIKFFLTKINLNKKLQNIFQKDLRDLSLYIFSRSLFIENEINSIIKNNLNIDVPHFVDNENLHSEYHVKEKLIEKKISYYESNIYMKNQLLRDSDWASMSKSIELRVPFANSEIIDYFSKYINNKKTRERILKNTNKQIYNIIKNKPKTGFSIPIDVLTKEIQTNQNPYRNFSIEIIKQFLNQNLNESY